MQLVVAGRRHILSIESAGAQLGAEGFFVDDYGDAGIRVPEGATDREIEERVQSGLAVAIRHFSKGLLN